MTAPDDTSYLWTAPASYAENQHIRAWWSQPQDQVLARLIEQYAWLYPWHISEAIVAVTSEDVIAAWREEDPVCQRYAWYNVLTYFGESVNPARPHQDGLIRPHLGDWHRG